MITVKRIVRHAVFGQEMLSSTLRDAQTGVKNA